MSDLNTAESLPILPEVPNTYGTPFGTAPEMPKAKKPLLLSISRFVTNPEEALAKLSPAELAKLKTRTDHLDVLLKEKVSLKETLDVFVHRDKAVLPFKLFEEKGQLAFVESRLTNTIVPKGKIELLSNYLLKKLAVTIDSVSKDFSDAKMEEYEYDDVVQQVKGIVETKAIKLDESAQREAQRVEATVKTGNMNLETGYWESEISEFSNLAAPDVTNERNYSLYRSLRNILENENNGFSKLVGVVIELNRINKNVEDIPIDQRDDFINSFSALLQKILERTQIDFNKRSGILSTSIDAIDRTLSEDNSSNEAILFLSQNTEALEVCNNAFFSALYLFLTSTIVSRLKAELEYKENLIEIDEMDITSILNKDESKPEATIGSIEKERKSLEEMKTRIDSFIDSLEQTDDFSAMPNLTKLLIVEEDSEDIKKLKEEINRLIFLLKRASVAESKPDVKKAQEVPAIPSQSATTTAITNTPVTETNNNDVTLKPGQRFNVEPKAIKSTEEQLDDILQKAVIETPVEVTPGTYRLSIAGQPVLEVRNYMENGVSKFSYERKSATATINLQDIFNPALTPPKLFNNLGAVADLKEGSEFTILGIEPRRYLTFLVIDGKPVFLEVTEQTESTKFFNLAYRNTDATKRANFLDTLKKSIARRVS